MEKKTHQSINQSEDPAVIGRLPTFPRYVERNRMYPESVMPKCSASENLVRIELLLPSGGDHEYFVLNSSPAVNVWYRLDASMGFSLRSLRLKCDKLHVKHTCKVISKTGKICSVCCCEHLSSEWEQSSYKNYISLIAWLRIKHDICRLDHLFR